VAANGDGDSVGALHLAAEFARRDGASVLVVGVAERLPASVTAIPRAKPFAPNEQERLMMLDEIHRAVRRVRGAERWEKRAVLGTPADVVIAVAEREKASLVLVGLRHRGRLRRIFGGETTVPLMRHSRVPILAVPATVRAIPKRVVVGIDFSVASSAAALIAAGLAARGGVITLAHASSLAGYPARPGDLADLYRAGARAKLDMMARELKGARQRIETALIDGEPGDALLTYARKHRCDLIALGGPEQGLAERVLLGSVRTRVVREARCSVLVVPLRAK
jgi:nucleotide-binding universal stress UspA family protein